MPLSTTHRHNQLLSHPKQEIFGFLRKGKQLLWHDPLLLSSLSTGNIVDPSLKPQVTCYKIPRLVKKLLALILKPLVSSWPPAQSREVSARP